MVGITKLSTYLMTMPQVKMTERESLPPVMLFTTVVEYKLNWRKRGNYYDAERGVGGGDIRGK